MRIGFAGAHRTGKTTLARAIAGVYGLPQLENNVSRIVKAYGFDLAQGNRLTTAGIMMQRDQLIAMEREIVSVGDRFITDRTPLDLAAYLIADATASAGAGTAYQERTVEYVERAMRLTAQHFDLVILVPPALPVEPVDGKPPVNPAYQEHLNLLVRGMLFDAGMLDTNSAEIQRECLSIPDRMDAVAGFIESHFGVLPTGVAA